ncbi:cysteine desulfurase [Aureococcus anophagefferens]|nr:cysteine desulfurase [Aureococcus anophagefferens]
MAWRTLLLLLAAATNAQSASVATDALPPPAAPNALLPPCAPLLAAARRIPVPADAFFMPANLSYLNVGSLGPTPRAAVDCAVERWKELEADKVSRYPWSGGLPEATRALAASGLLYVHRAARPMIAPTYLDEGFSAYTQCTGTTPLQTIAGLGYALAFVDALGGQAALRAHNAALYGVTYAALAKLPRVAILSAPPGSGLDSALLSFALPACAPHGAVAGGLAARGIVVKLLPDGEGGTPLVANALRVSHHVFNAAADMERFAASLAAEVDARCAGLI